MNTLVAGLVVGFVAYYVYRPTSVKHERAEVKDDDVDVKTMTPFAFQNGRTNKNPQLYRTMKV